MFSQQILISRSMYMNRMDIYETYNGGAITKIEVKNPDNTWFLMYSQPASRYQTARIFSPNLTVTKHTRTHARTYTHTLTHTLCHTCILQHII